MVVKTSDESVNPNIYPELVPSSLYGLNKLDDDGLNVLEKIINNAELKWNDGDLLEDRDPDTSKEDFSTRKCKTVFLNYYQELDKLFGRIIADYNRNYSGWNFNLECIESLQLSHYYEGDFYDWHVDAFLNPIIRNAKPYNRKISVTLFLNDPEEYEGGEFDLELRGPNSNEERFDSFKLPKGSIITFPSYTWHRVRPVTSGVKKSLVLWIQGPPFR